MKGFAGRNDFAFRKPVYGAQRGGRFKSKRRRGYGSNLQRRVQTLERSQETHRYEQSNGATVAPAGTVTHLTQIAEDDGIANRTGNQVTITYIGLRGELVANSSSTGQSVRVSIVQDLQQISDSAFLYTDVFSGSSPFSFIDSDTSGRFRILYDELYTLSDGAGEYRTVKVNLTKKIEKTGWNGPLATDIQSNGIYLLVNASDNSFPMSYVLISMLHWKH